MDKVTIIVPSLNEIEGLKKYLPAILPEWYDQLIVLVGKPIKDDSIEWCRKYDYEYFVGDNNLWVGYTNLFNSGVVTGDIIITLSPDGNSIIDVIPRLIAKIKQCNDLVIASRYLYGARSDDDTFLTKVGNRFLTGLVNFGSRKKYTDALVMYRAYRKWVIKDLGLAKSCNVLQKKLIKMSGLYSYEPSMAIRAAKANLRITEISASEPLAYRNRRQNTFVHGFVILTQILMEKLWKPKS